MDRRTSSAVAVVLFVGISCHIASSQIIPTPKIPCDELSNCTIPSLPADAQCISGYCTCPDETGAFRICEEIPQSHAQPKAAVHNNPVTAISCKIPQDCQQLAHSFCNTTVNQCDCIEGYVRASANLTCLPVAKGLGSSCTQEEQCGAANSTCRNGQCVCITGYHYNENSCWRTVEIEKSCKFTQECSHVEGAVCNEQMMCQCPADKVINKVRSTCLPVVTEILGECVEEVQCTKKFANADCIQKRCECKENEHFEQSVSGCVSSKHLGDSCAKDYECYQDQEEGETDEPQKCVENVCTCNENFKKEGDKCMRSAATSLGPVAHISVLLSVLLFFRS